MMNLKKEILDYIKEITKDAYRDYKLQLDLICKELDVKKFIADFEDNISGFIKKNKETGKFEIFLNGRHPQNRRRFTLAHELGHFISFKHSSFSKNDLDKEEGLADYAISYRIDGGNSVAEIEANQIAAMMLMPQDKVEELKNKGLVIEEMAEMFFVSPSAMTIRLQNLYPSLSIYNV